MICVSLMLVGMLYDAARKRSVKAALDLLRKIDYSTLLLLFGLFMVVGGITETGVIDAVAALFTKIGGGSVFLIYTILRANM